jgi:hypothetical protein
VNKVNNKFEKLIEYVINDEDAKASDLFHEIVVGKSREIYEGLMQDDMGGDAVDDFIDDVSSDEEGIDYADDSDEDEDTVEMDFDGDETEASSDETEELEDRVVDLEDKLDELMAEFDDLIGDEATEEEDEVVDMDSDMDFAVDTDEELSFEESADEDIDEDKEELEEDAKLVNAPKPVTSEEGSVNTTSANAHDAGKKSKTDARPVQTSTATEKGRPAPKAKDLGVDGPEGGAELIKAPALKKGE